MEFSHFKTAMQFSRVGANTRLAQRLAFYRRLAAKALAELAKQGVEADELLQYHLAGEHDQCDHAPTEEGRAECEAVGGPRAGKEGKRKRSDSFKGKAWIESLNNYEHKNVKGWTQDREWMILNKTLRRGKLTAVQEIRAKQLESAVGKSVASKTMTTYRGMSLPGKVGPMKVGAVFRDKGFAATTLQQSTARDFVTESNAGTYMMMKVTVPKGAPAAYLANFPGTKHRNEKEVLLNRGSKFKVKAVRSMDFATPIDRFKGIKRDGYFVDVVLVK